VHCAVAPRPVGAFANLKVGAPFQISTVRLRIEAAPGVLHSRGSIGSIWGGSRGPRELPVTAVRSPAHAGEGFPRERDGARIVLPGPGGLGPLTTAPGVVET